MGNALRMGLMGAALGGLHELRTMADEARQLAAEAYSERLRRARMLEEHSLRLGEAAVNREEMAKIKQAQYERSREDKLEDDKRKAERDQQEKAADRAFKATESAKSRDFKAEENEKQRKVYGETNRFKPSIRTVKNPEPDGPTWLYADPASGEFMRDKEGRLMEAPPPYRERKESGSVLGGLNRQQETEQQESTDINKTFDPNQFLQQFGVQKK